MHFYNLCRRRSPTSKANIPLLPMVTLLLFIVLLSSPHALAQSRGVETANRMTSANNQRRRILKNAKSMGSMTSESASDKSSKKSGSMKSKSSKSVSDKSSKKSESMKSKSSKSLSAKSSKKSESMKSKSSKSIKSKSSKSSKSVANDQTSVQSLESSSASHTKMSHEAAGVKENDPLVKKDPKPSLLSSTPVQLGLAATILVVSLLIHFCRMKQSRNNASHASGGAYKPISMSGGEAEMTELGSDDENDLDAEYGQSDDKSDFGTPGSFQMRAQ